MKVPQHIAIILDGNGRWAKAKGMPRITGMPRAAKMWSGSVKRPGEWESNI